MSTVKQIEANRRNAQKSTGPTTESGRRASSLNAYKHGLTGQLFVMTAGEAEAHQRFTTAMLEDLKPVGIMEETLARSLADAYWRLNRASIIENNIFTVEAFQEEYLAIGEAARQGLECRFNDVNRSRSAVASFVNDPHRFQLLTVYEARLHRRAQADLRQLRELQAARRIGQKALEQQTTAQQNVAMEKPATAPPQPRPEPAVPSPVATQAIDLETLNTSNGFVCSSIPKTLKEIENYIMADPRRPGIDCLRT